MVIETDSNGFMHVDCSIKLNSVAWQSRCKKLFLTGVEQETLVSDEEGSGKCITGCEDAIDECLSSTGEALIDRQNKHFELLPLVTVCRNIRCCRFDVATRCLLLSQTSNMNMVSIVVETENSGSMHENPSKKLYIVAWQSCCRLLSGQVF